MVGTSLDVWRRVGDELAQNHDFWFPWCASARIVPIGGLLMRPGRSPEQAAEGKMSHPRSCKMSVKTKTEKFYFNSWEILKDLRRSCKNVNRWDLQRSSKMSCNATTKKSQIFEELARSWKISQKWQNLERSWQKLKDLARSRSNRRRQWEKNPFVQ
jgi:hypothetical protein